MHRILLIFLFSSLFSLSTEDVYDNSWALVVGINKYEHVKNLDYAVQDAKSIKELLINNFQFQEDNIIFLLNEEATYMKIKKSLSKITRNAGENDRILIFFAGHGLTLDLPESGEMGFLIPVDGEADDLYGSSLEMDELRKVSSLSKAKHMLYLVDACYGGLAATNTRGLDISTPGFLNKITEDKARQIITAGGRDEPSIEKAEWGHSAFTLNVIRGLKDGAADLNYDGMITGEELGTFLETRVKKDSNNKQTPQVRRFTSHEGEFVFFKSIDTDNVILNENTQTRTLTDYEEADKRLNELMGKLEKIVKDEEGCKDPKACNYDRDASIDDGSCDYSCIETARLALKNYNKNNNTIEVYVEFDTQFGGIQWNFEGANMIGAFGGVLEELNFTTTIGENTLLSFSFTGASFKPASETLLTILQLEPSSDKITSICLVGIVISDHEGNSLKVIDEFGNVGYHCLADLK